MFRSSNTQAIKQAEQELEMITTLYNNIINSCHSKCISNSYLEGDLHKGESVCIERCVAKYFEANAKVGGKLSGNPPPS
jgi:import inner membrane translocase subunit TIM10